MAVAVHYHSHCRILLNPNVFKSSPPNPLLFLHRSRRPCFKSSFFPSGDLFPSSSPSTARTSVPPQEGSVPPLLLQDPFRPNRFLTNEEYEKLKFLENFSYCEELESGSLWVRVMRPEEMDATVELLSDSFAESMMPPVPAADVTPLSFFVTLLSLFVKLYASLLSVIVKSHLTKRRAAMPHAATLVGFYRGKAEEDDGEGVEELAGTVEVSFDKRGANASPPTPSPPTDKPYICNMTVKKPLRRRGIGWHLLKASEKLISEMSSSKEVYLHCRMIDEAPFNMYLRAGYNVLKTDSDSIFRLLTLQRRMHLMCKNLPTLDADSETDISGNDKEPNL